MSVEMFKAGDIVLWWSTRLPGGGKEEGQKLISTIYNTPGGDTLLKEWAASFCDIENEAADDAVRFVAEKGGDTVASVFVVIDENRWLILGNAHLGEYFHAGHRVAR